MPTEGSLRARLCESPVLPSFSLAGRSLQARAARRGQVTCQQDGESGPQRREGRCRLTSPNTDPEPLSRLPPQGH